MIEAGIVAGYLIAWAMRKVRRVGVAVDGDVDEILDAQLERLHGVVGAKLGDDPALAKLQAEVAAVGEVSDRTRRRVDDAISEAAEGDPAFSDALQAAVAPLAGQSIASVSATGKGAVAVGGDAVVRADRGSVAAMTMGSVTIGVPPTTP